MPLDVPPTNPDGSLREYTTDEIEDMEIRHVGVRDGAHPTFRRRINDNTVSAEYFCAYAELEAFICYMLGFAKVWDDSGTFKLSRLLPRAYPGKNYTVATSLDEARGHRYTGEQEEDGRPIYDKWKCRFTFQQVPFLLQTDDEIALGSGSEVDRYVQELPSSAQPDYVTLPGGVLKFAPEGGGGITGTAIPHNVGFVNPSCAIRKKWIRVPYIGWQEGSGLRTRVFGDIEDDEEPYLGTINQGAIFGYSPGQLLLTSVEDELLLDPINEEQHWNLTFTWLARSVSHNWFKFFDPAGTNTGWSFVSNDGTYYDSATLPDNKSLFNARDHKLLFDVD